MTKEILALVKRWRKDLAFEAGDVLEIGSYNVNGTIRDCFKDAKSYLGVDQEAGPDVDLVLDAKMLWTPRVLPKEQYDTVICCEMLEHCSDPLRVVRGMASIVRSGGHMLITSPAYGFPVHRHPRDYFRFGEDTYRDIFFNGFQLLRLEQAVEQQTGYACWCALGCRP